MKWVTETAGTGVTVTFSGRVTNSHPEYTLENVMVVARMLDQDANLIDEIQIQVGTGTLAPGENRNYSGTGKENKDFRYYTLVLTYTWKTS